MREYRCMRVTDKILICTKNKNSHLFKIKEDGNCCILSVCNKEVCEKRVSMLTHRELSIAKSKLKIQFKPSEKYIIYNMKSLFKYSLYSSRTEDC